MKKGKLIAVYGINGIGKTTQVDLLVEYLRSKGLNANRLKVPVYDLEPEGPFINKYLRDPEFRLANPKTTHELQYLYMLNRLRYKDVLEERLASGEWVVVEDYTGTGIAWGLTWGGDLNFLERINKGLIQEDISILMDGERFLSAVEKGHRNEGNDERIILCKNFLRLLAGRYNWHIAYANESIDNVQENIRNLITL